MCRWRSLHPLQIHTFVATGSGFCDEHDGHYGNYGNEFCHGIDRVIDYCSAGTVKRDRNETDDQVHDPGYKRNNKQAAP
jgi:hypothetical protein